MNFNCPAWIVETFQRALDSFEKRESSRLTYLTSEIKTAMLLAHTLSPSILSKWTNEELMHLNALVRSHYEN